MAEQEFYSILTEKGKEKEMKCLNGECAYDIWEIAVGDGNGSYYEPETTQIALKNECWRGLVACCENEDETRYAIAHIPADVGGFTIREIGAFDKAGNLLIIGKCAENTKKLPETGDIKQLSYRVDLSIINKLVLPFIIDPSINTPSINYVEKHFQALNEKSKPDGYAPLDNKAKVPLEHLQSPYIPLCFNSGPVDENGEPALLQLSTVTETMPSENTAQAGAVASDEDDTSTTQATWNDSSPGAEGGEEIFVTRQIVTLKAPAVYTDGNGKTLTITEDLTLDVTDFEPGAEYSLRVAENINSGAVEFFAVEGGKVYRQKAEPENPKDGDLWQNLSVAPSLAYIYSALQTENIDENSETAPAGTWQITNQVEAGAYIVPSENSGGGGVIKTRPYNIKPHIENIETKMSPAYSTGTYLIKTVDLVQKIPEDCYLQYYVYCDSYARIVICDSDGNEIEYLFDVSTQGTQAHILQYSNLIKKGSYVKYTNIIDNQERHSIKIIPAKGGITKV